MKITLFGTQPYDWESFDRIRDTYGFDVCYHRSHLNANNVALAQGSDGLHLRQRHGRRRDHPPVGRDGREADRAALCGLHNVDLNAAARYGIPVVRVPAIRRTPWRNTPCGADADAQPQIHRAYWRTRDNFSLHGLMGFDMYGKTAGIVGTGRIARELIRILKGSAWRSWPTICFPDPQYAAEAGHRLRAARRALRPCGHRFAPLSADRPDAT